MASGVRRMALCTLLLAAASAPAWAHPVPFTYLDLRIGQSAIEGTLVAHMFDVGHDLGVDPPERLLEPRTVADRAAAIIDLLSPRLIVSADGRVLSPTWSDVEPIADRQSLRLRVRFPLSAPAGSISVAANLFPYDPNHQTFVNIYEGDALTQAILDRSRSELDYFAGSAHGIVAVVGTFVRVGMRHILLGPDHLLFLAGLLLLGGTLGRMALLVTGFTVAHAVTLALAALNVVAPPARFIEPAIALSIVYVGADNLLIRDGRDVRIWIAIAFGFIHGFGYAADLRPLDLTARALRWSIAAVNIGMEIAQLAVVAAVAAALAVVRSRSETAGRRLAFAGSVVVVAVGTFWFVQRVFFPGGMS